MKTHIRRARPAFTLVEVLVVMTIIAILAGLVVVGMEFAKQRQASEKAKVQIALLSKGIEEYKADMGFYPGDVADTPVEGKVSKQIYQVLFYEGYDYDKQGNPAAWEKKLNTGEIVPKATKIYIAELDPRNNKMGWVTKLKLTETPSDKLEITDPWGNGYRYRKGNDAQNPDFDLWSIGKDGKTNATSPAMTIDENKDDIRNF